MIDKIRRNAAQDWLKFRLWFMRNLSTVLMTIIAILVGLIFLIMIVQASNARKEVEAHREQAEETLQQLKDITENAKREADENAKRDQQVHNEIKDFLCELVRLAPPERITSEQLALCEGYPPPPGQNYPKPVTYMPPNSPTRTTTRQPRTTSTPAPTPTGTPRPPSSGRGQPREPEKLESQLTETPSKKPAERLIEQVELCHKRSRKL